MLQSSWSRRTLRSMKARSPTPLPNPSPSRRPLAAVEHHRELSSFATTCLYRLRPPSLVKCPKSRTRAKRTLKSLSFVLSFGPARIIQLVALVLVQQILFVFFRFAIRIVDATIAIAIATFVSRIAFANLVSSFCFLFRFRIFFSTFQFLVNSIIGVRAVDLGSVSFVQLDAERCCCGRFVCSRRISDFFCLDTGTARARNGRYRGAAGGDGRWDGDVREWEEREGRTLRSRILQHLGPALSALVHSFVRSLVCSVGVCPASLAWREACIAFAIDSLLETSPR